MRLSSLLEQRSYLLRVLRERILMQGWLEVCVMCGRQISLEPSVTPRYLHYVNASILLLMGRRGLDIDVYKRQGKCHAV